MSFERGRAAEQAAEFGEETIETVRPVLDGRRREALDSERVRMVADRGRHDPLVLEDRERSNHIIGLARCFVRGDSGCWRVVVAVGERVEVMGWVGVVSFAWFRLAAGGEKRGGGLRFFFAWIGDGA